MSGEFEALKAMLINMERAELLFNDFAQNVTKAIEGPLRGAKLLTSPSRAPSFLIQIAGCCFLFSVSLRNVNATYGRLVCQRIDPVSLLPIGEATQVAFKCDKSNSGGETLHGDPYSMVTLDGAAAIVAQLSMAALGAEMPPVKYGA